MVGITRAFSQSRELSESGKYIAVSPPCIFFGGSMWKGPIAIAPGDRRASPYGMLRHRPLCGSKCAPPRLSTLFGNTSITDAALIYGSPRVVSPIYE